MMSIITDPSRVPFSQTVAPWTKLQIILIWTVKGSATDVLTFIGIKMLAVNNYVSVSSEETDKRYTRTEKPSALQWFQDLK